MLLRLYGTVTSWLWLFPKIPVTDAIAMVPVCAMFWRRVWGMCNHPLCGLCDVSKKTTIHVVVHSKKTLRRHFFSAVAFRGKTVSRVTRFWHRRVCVVRPSVFSLQRPDAEVLDFSLVLRGNESTNNLSTEKSYVAASAPTVRLFWMTALLLHLSLSWFSPRRHTRSQGEALRQ